MYRVRRRLRKRPQCVNAEISRRYYGKGCNEADDVSTLLRRCFHHFYLYGFTFRFAAICRGDGPSPRRRFERPLFLASAGHARHAGRYRFVYRPGRATVVQSAAVAVMMRARKPMDRGFILLRRSNQPYRAGAGRQRHRWNGHIAGAPFRRVVMALFSPFPWRKFRPRFFRRRGLTKWAVEKRRGKHAGIQATDPQHLTHKTIKTVESKPYGTTQYLHTSRAGTFGAMYACVTSGNFLNNSLIFLVRIYATYIARTFFRRKANLPH